MELTIEDRLILAGVKLNLSENDIRHIEEAISLINNWPFFTENAIQNGAGPLLYKNLQQISNTQLIPIEFFEKFKKTYFRSLSRNMVLYEHLKNISELFSNEGIDIIALKGILIAAEIYGDIALRQMSDIDLLLKEDEVEKAWTILQDNGYQYKGYTKSNLIFNLSDRKHMPQLIKNGVPVELHYRTHLLKKGFNINIQDYWLKSQAVVLNGRPMRKLCPEHQIQHSCVHLDEHYMGGKPQIYAFIDIAGVINKYANEIDWNYFDACSTAYKYDNIVYKYLFLLNTYFNIDFPPFILDKAKKMFDTKTDRLFVHYLRHYKKDLPLKMAPINYEILSQIKGFKNKWNYLKDDIFPSRAFMRARYKIKNNKLIYWFYFKRIFKGLYTVFLILLKKFFISTKEDNT